MRKPSLPIALVSYALAIGVVLVVALTGILNLSRTAADRLVAIRVHEHYATLTERLRWASEQKIAAGRGYLISGRPLFRDKLEQATAKFSTMKRDLRRLEDDAESTELLSQLDAAVVAYDGAQDDLIVLKERTHDVTDLERRFERDLQPMRRRLDRAIDAYVARRAVVLDQAYELFEKQRTQAVALAIGSITLAAMMAAMLVFFVSRRLARVHARERRALAQAEAALAARDEILGIVAHDLRSPLAAIVMRAGFMKTEAQDENGRHQAESIESAAIRMEHLINRLLDVSTIEGGPFAVRPERCDVNEIVRKSLELFDSAAAKKGIHLDASAVEPTLAVQGDKEHLIQVLSNLLGNAIKFTPDGGRVRISVERAQRMVRFSVCDTGPGIAPEHVPHVFDRFWKQDRPGAYATGRRSTKGTGLGLYIAKGIVEAHGGQMWADTEPGSGAIFRFRVPMAEADSTFSIRTADRAKSVSSRLH